MSSLILIPIAVLCGILGRLGGAAKSGSWYDVLCDTKARDVGCSVLCTLAMWLKFGAFAKFWWVYLIIFGLTWGALTTYWDKVFKFDNLWFSGFVVGLCGMPLLAVKLAWVYIVARAIVLALIWGALNTIKYNKLLVWRRDVAEEFLRYASIIL